jgi:hypothetical protein
VLVAGADLDADGVADLLAGAPGWDGGIDAGGAALVISGAGLLAEVP